MELKEAVEISNSYGEVLRHLGISSNGREIKQIKLLCLESSLSTRHFGSRYVRRLYPDVLRECPVCSTAFVAQEGHPKEKKTCSYACSNTFFRKGIHVRDYKGYRPICFAFHKHECVICGESKIVAVHHMDENKKNNDPVNLIPLCPTHHQYWHSHHRPEVEARVLAYIEDFKNKSPNE